MIVSVTPFFLIYLLGDWELYYLVAQLFKIKIEILMDFCCRTFCVLE